MTGPVLSEERVRYYASLNDPVRHGQGVRFSFDEVAQLAADWLALRRQNATLRAMVEEALALAVLSTDEWGREQDAQVDSIRSRLAALGEP